ncbi:hypothetical protein BKA58DRAFT_315003, partial [Alternaria rosae]|uniref:uncharacterized protein n=1 Tax=Alternaria rosae TaxID=1187941 RepID=UPI001E8DCDBB
TPLSINIGSFANLIEYYKYVYNMLKEKLEHLYVSINSFAKVFFRDVLSLRLAVVAVFNKCKKGKSLLF